MKEESIVHIKINYEDAIESKKDVLSIERDFLNVLKTMKKYSLLRKEELTLKLKMQNKLKELNTNLTRMDKTLPKVRIPNILKKKKDAENIGQVIEKAAKVPKTVIEKEDDDLERQLREIQEKLKRLG